MAEICISVGSTNDSSQLDRSGSAKIELVVQGENARRVKELNGKSNGYVMGFTSAFPAISIEPWINKLQ
jgi:hypothetical protein